MWGGRFDRPASPLLQAINVSLDVDRRLADIDVEGSLAHAAMLAARGIISSEDHAAIRHGLEAIAKEIADGRFPFRHEYEDIHMNVEARLRELVGPAAGRLHTARSRNDQVVTDFKLWTRRAMLRAADGLRTIMRALVARAEAHADWVMPGFTHLQTAQPVTLGHHLLAYVEMLCRDVARFEDAHARADTCPLGAAALAGTGFAIDREMTARALGFAAPAANSMDAVASRDFALDFLAAAAIAGMHLSRLADEIVLWTSPQFGFASLSGAWSTGSSIMPQKRNPDAAELVRAKAARLGADFQALVALMRALPLTYSKDLQDDKAITFGAADTLALVCDAMAGMVEDLAFDRARMRAAAALGFSTATDLADWLVREAGLPFRDAHHVTGAVVRRAEALGLASLEAMPLEEMQAIDPRIGRDAMSVLTVENSVHSRASQGGTAPVRVREVVGRWKERLG
jgi:argininosuccinate lyase